MKRSWNFLENFLKYCKFFFVFLQILWTFLRRPGGLRHPEPPKRRPLASPPLVDLTPPPEKFMRTLMKPIFSKSLLQLNHQTIILKPCKLFSIPTKEAVLSSVLAYLGLRIELRFEKLSNNRSTLQTADQFSSNISK